MENVSYVVHLVESDNPQPLKVFELRGRAIAFAEEQVGNESVERADIYEVVGALNAKAAVAALQMGDGRLIEMRCRRASDAELLLAEKRRLARGITEEDLWGVPDR